MLATPKTHFAARQPNDARTTGLNHLDVRPVTEPQLLETVNVFRTTAQLQDPSRLAVT
jgi:hypothetical protein